MAKDPILIVGGGRAAASLIDAYREAGGDALITLVSSDEQPPYNRPPLSKGVLRGEMEPVRRAGPSARGLRRPGRRVTSRNHGRVGGHQGPYGHGAAGEELSYGTLVIATGARPRALAVPGDDLPAVHTFRTLADAEAVKAEAAEARKALVVGGSFIGSEVAASLSMLGVEVTLVELGERLVPALASAELSSRSRSCSRSTASSSCSARRSRSSTRTDAC